jgi:hypothetical protein
VSELGLLTHQYELNAKFFKQFSDALLLVKRVHYNLPGARGVSPLEIVDACRVLDEVLEDIYERLFELNAEEHKEGARDVPGVLVERVSQSKAGELDLFRADLQDAQQRLRLDARKLKEVDIQLLDEVCRFADLTTTALYRRIWRV